ncbi:hypothetical protein Chor_002461 [Crotalus horridus]
METCTLHLVGGEFGPRGTVSSSGQAQSSETLPRPTEPAVHFSGPAPPRMLDVAMAFGEHLSPMEITDLMLKIIEALTHEEKTICQAAGVLLLSFLEECVMDMEEVPKILKEICQRLPNISEPATKQNTLKSVCHLASKWVKEVVDFLLERSPDCDQ